MDKDARELKPTTKSSRSLRRLALIITGIGAGTALAMILLQLIVNHIHYSGVLIIPGLIFIIGYMAIVGGLVTLMVDVVLRLSGRGRYRKWNAPPLRAGVAVEVPPLVSVQGRLAKGWLLR